MTYLKYVKRKGRYSNFGLGGDTLAGMTKRLSNVVGDPEYNKAETVVIGIGTNDVLHPFLAGYSKAWARVVERLAGRGSIPCRDENEFGTKYEELLQMLADTGKKVIIFGIPLIETDIPEMNKKAEAYNRLIMELCERFKVEYIDIMGLQRQIKTGLDNHGAKFFAVDIFEPVLLTIFTTYLPFADRISKMRGLAVTVDGVHMNTISAKGLAGLIDSAVQRLEECPEGK